MITSTQNPKIKDLLRLSKSKDRKERKLFLIEGRREILRAMENGYRITKIFYCREMIKKNHSGILAYFTDDQKFEVNPHVFSRIAYRDNNDGMLAIAAQKSLQIDDFKPGVDGLYLVLETVEKPGNLGAMLRTADAAGIDAVIICDNQTDVYNPNVVRASMGCLFSTKVILTDSSLAIDFLKKHKIRILASTLQDSVDYYHTNMREATAIVMGSEAYGLSNVWREAADEMVKIPMQGVADSLNVSVSAAILIFEAIRQRNSESNF